MHFTKMHGLGNDYLYVFDDVPENIAELSKKLSDRHFGVGADGMIYISRSDTADFKMRIFNADGSEAKMCGNGIRCVGKYVYDKGYTKKKELFIETLSGIKKLKLNVSDKKAESVEVEMGKAEVSQNLQLRVDDDDVICTPVSVGNLHVVIFVPNAEEVQVDTLGKKIEVHEAFPGGVNVEFVEVRDEHTLRMRVWERGSGVTLACGTGACATVAAAAKLGYCPYDEPVSVLLDGGTLKIKIAFDKTVKMLGAAEMICEGDTIE